MKKNTDILIKVIIVMGSLLALFSGASLETLLLTLLFVLWITLWKYLKNVEKES